MVTQQTPFLLKVLGGSNAGAMVRLNVGETVIGRSMSSDIILHDEDIADSHLQLQVSGNSIIIKVLSHPVLIDREPLNADEAVLEPFQIVTLGNVDFFIADVRQGKDKTTADAATKASAISDPASPKVSAVKQSAQAGEAERSASSSSLRNTNPKRSGKGLLWLGVGVLLLANLIYFFPDLVNFAEKIGLKNSPLERAETIVAELGNENLVVEGDHKAALVTGYVDTLNEKREIMTRMSRAGSGVNYRIWASDELVTNAQQVAHALGQTGISFDKLGKGRLAASGYVSTGEDWEQIKSNIMNDVPGIQAIEDERVQTLIKRKQALEQFIDKKGLSSRIRVTIEGGRIKVDGELTQNELNRWGGLYQEFLTLNGDGPAIINNLYDARERIKLVIRSVSVGDTPFLVSKDGNKYMEGSSLGSNYFIEKITPDHVLLSNNGVEIPIYYGAEEK